MKIRMLPAAVLALALVGLPVGSAWAGAESGLGIFFDYVSDSMQDTGSSTSDDHAAGIGIGLDFQIAIGGIVSINPMAMFSFQPSGVQADTYGHQFLGVEGRVWFNNAFIGARTGQYQQHRSGFLGLGGETGSGSGWGVTLGSENDNGTFFAVLWDEAAVDFDTYSTDIKGYKLLIGKRIR
jgi:hypothetical protein